MEKIECKCKEKFDIGCVEASINKEGKRWVLGLEYQAYSTDSSFYKNDASIEIKYCPFCGKKF